MARCDRRRRGPPAAAIDPLLHALERKEFVRRVAARSVDGQTEYAFQPRADPRRRLRRHPARAARRKHALAADWIESLGRPQDHAELLAHHHLQALDYTQGAGERTDELAHKALGALQEAGDRAVSLNAYPAAAAFYERALTMVPASRDQRTRCDLLLSLGDAQARAGDTSASQETFLAAAEVARRAASADQLALAALGYGGRIIWQFSRGDMEHVPLLESALAVLGADDSPLRVRLLTRLAAGPLRDPRFPRERRRSVGEEALEMARRVEDPATLAYALAGYIAANHSPEFTRKQLTLGTELVQVAIEAGEPERAVEGHEHRITALLELGEIQAVKAEFARMAQLADELRQPSQDWYVASYGALLALLGGELCEGEDVIASARSAGLQAESWNAGVSHALQLYLLRREQGRLDEVEDLVRRSAERYRTLPIWRCVLAQMAAELGHTAEARAALDALADDGFANLPVTDDWLVSLGLLAEAASTLQETQRAPDLYQLLLPYGDRVAVSYTAFSTGSVARSLGLLATVTKRWDDAERHFEEALELNERVGARPWLARTQEDYARMLLARARPGDHDRALQLLADARSNFRELGMEAWAHRAYAEGG